jgi:hypothetical protein
MYAEAFRDTRVSTSRCWRSKNSSAGIGGMCEQWPDSSAKAGVEEKAESTVGFNLLNPRREAAKRNTAWMEDCYPVPPNE